jgi:hypothetical protein
MGAKARLTSIHVWNDSTNGANVHNGPSSSDEHVVKMMHHPHGPKDIDVKHALHSGDVSVDSRHGVAWEQSGLDSTLPYVLTRIEDSRCYICHWRQVSTHMQAHVSLKDQAKLLPTRS